MNFTQGRKESQKAQRDRTLVIRLQIDTLKAQPYDRHHNATEELPCRGQAG